MITLLKWIAPALFTAGYAWLGLSLRDRALRRKFGSPASADAIDSPQSANSGQPVLLNAELRRRLLDRLSAFALAISSAALLTALWPLDARYGEFLPSAIKLTVVGFLAITARELVEFALERAPANAAWNSPQGRLWIWSACGVAFGTLTLSALQITVAPLIGALTLGLFAAAVGLRDLLADLAAGAWFARRPPFAPGDHIRVAHGRAFDAPRADNDKTSQTGASPGGADPFMIEGRVENVDWAHTTLADARGVRALIPNRRLLGSAIQNFGPAGRSVFMEARVMISPDIGLDRALKSVTLAAEATLEEGAWLTAAASHDFAPPTGETNGGGTRAEIAGPPAPRVVVEGIGGRGSAVLILLPARDFAAVEELRHLFLLTLHRRLKTDRIGLAHEEPGMPTQAIKVAASNAG